MKKIIIILLTILFLTSCTKEEIKSSHFDRFDITYFVNYISNEILDYPELLIQDDYYNIVENKEICGHWRELNFRNPDSDLKYDKYGTIYIYYLSGIYVYFSTSSSFPYIASVSSYKCSGDIITTNYGNHLSINRYELSEDGNTLSIYENYRSDSLLTVLEKIQ